MSICELEGQITQPAYLSTARPLNLRVEVLRGEDEINSFFGATKTMIKIPILGEKLNGKC